MRERGAEVGALQAALGDARAGEGRLVVLEAPAGLGKTTLLDVAARDAANRGMRVLRARGTAAERAFPFAVALQLVEAELARLDPEERDAALGGAAAPAAALLAGSAADAFEAVHALHWVVVNLAEAAPVAVLVDDAHWADDPSVRLLAYLAHRLAALPVALVLAVRPGEPDAAGGLDALVADPATTVLRPAALSAAAVAEQVRAGGFEAATDAFCAACARASGGNPFLLGELLRTLAAAGVAADAAAAVEAHVPDTVARSVLGRVRRLGPAALAVARAVDVLGEDARLELVAAVAGVDPAVAATAVDDLAATGVLAAGDPVAFAHPLTGAAVHEDAPAAGRRVAHGRAAALLRAAGAPVDRVAAHLLAGPVVGDGWAGPLLRIAGDRARRRGAAVAADALLARALEEPWPAEARAAVVVELAEVRAGLAPTAAIDLLHETLEALPRGLTRARALRVLGDALVSAGRHAEAGRAMQEGLELAEGEDPELARQLGASLVMVGAVRPELAGVAAEHRRRIATATGATTPGERSVLVALAVRACFELQPCAEPLRLARRALEGDRLLAGEGADVPRWSVANAVLVWADDLDGSIAACDAALAVARARGNPMAFATASACRATPAYWAGRLDEAAADAEQALAHRDDGWRTWFGLAGGVLVACRLERGDVDGAAALLPELEAAAAEAPEFRAYVGVARGRVLAARGEVREALDELLAAGAALHHPNPAALPWRSLAAELAARLGERDRAVALATEELDLARRFGAARPVGIAARALGTVTGDRAQLEEAVAVLRGSPARLELAGALTDLGMAIRAEGDAVGARAVLREALGLADELGATVLTARAREALVLAGGRPRRAAQSGVRALTAAERRIAGLAAEGLTNREIAEALFVTPKTVSFHLGAVYRKLGVRTRPEIAAAIAADRASGA